MNSIDKIFIQISEKNNDNDKLKITTKSDWIIRFTEKMQQSKIQKAEQKRKKKKYSCLKNCKYDSWTYYDNKESWSARWNSSNSLIEILSENYITFKIWNQMKKDYSNWIQ